MRRPASPSLNTRGLALLVSALLATLGCASSVLIDRDDATFASAQRRLIATAERVDRERAGPEERLLFLQGEGFYRYRFAAPPRGAAGYLAQGAAAMMDFPAMQALAGSLDLADLRLRAYDGSVQLWETLLQRHPDTVLRPLTLY